ncbi:cytochrome c3 family protein [Neobacillus sp. YIM B06451]|uniref:cytochrome c3 family protein n=1 Tax=Neobacillus sp. YIM B06451 TaxID=3070994 RepID=UPI00292DE75F|nr:cytochrome c3 family protein [Neobacillus sp. YIM B06451]
MKKFSFSLLFAIMLLGIFAAAASAQDPANNDAGKNHNEEQTAPQAGVLNENANNTGSGVDVVKPDGNFDEVIKNVDGHKTHGEYQNNTNSCASCHQTHTSKGKQLLFADTTYQTCAACHDGTLGFYNVFETGANADLNGGGTFGGSHVNNMSIHQSNDAILIKAAPGGNKNGTSTTGQAQWGASFSCASCHAPHGSYSDRLLHYNPNGMATTPRNVVNGDNLGGNRIDNLVPTATVPTSGSDYKLVISESSAVEDEVASGVKAKVLYLYKGATKQEVPMLYGYGSHGTPHFTHLAYKTKAVTEDNSPTGWKGSLVQVNDTTKGLKWETIADQTVVWEKPAGTFKLDNGDTFTGVKADLKEVKSWVDSTSRIEYGDPDVYFSNEHGYFKALTVKGNDILNGLDTDNYGAVVGQVSLAYTVDMDLQVVQNIDGLKIYKNNQSAYWTEKTLNNTGTTKDFVGQGVKMSEFCAACHTDYLAKSSSSTGVKSGSYSKSFRHTTTSASYSCVRCHFAHGTDAEIMMDADGKTVAQLTATGGKFVGDKNAALAYMKDKNNSSALKKFTNMTVCWACHNSSKATTIKNTNRPEGHPNGMPMTDVNFGGTIKSIQR